MWEMLLLAFAVTAGGMALGILFVWVITRLGFVK